MTAIVMSANPENGANTKKVVRANCSTKDCLLTPEYGDRCTHCRNVPRVQSADVKRSAVWTVLSLTLVVGSVIVIGGVYAAWK